MKAKVYKPDFSPMETSYVILCGNCEGDTFRLESNLDPMTRSDWEIDRMICTKCGAVMFDEDEEG